MIPCGHFFDLLIVLVKKGKEGCTATKSVVPNRAVTFELLVILSGVAVITVTLTTAVPIRHQRMETIKKKRASKTNVHLKA